MRIFIAALLLLRIYFDGANAIEFSGYPLNGWLSLLILTTTALFVITGRGKYTATVLCVSALLVVSSVFASFEWGISPVLEGIRMVSVVCLFYLAVSIRVSFSQRGLVLLFGTMSSLCALVAIAQTLSGGGFFVTSVWRYQGLMAHPNSAALVYGIAVILIFEVIQSKKQRTIDYLNGFLALIGLSLTLSIGGAFASFFAFMVVLLLGNRSRRSRVTATLTLAITSLVFVSTPGVASRVSGYSDASMYAAGDQTNSLVWRFGHWAELIPFFLQSPLVGLGYGSSTSGLLTSDGLYPHSEYVRLLVETGLLGLLIFSLLLIAIIAEVNKSFIWGIDRRQRASLIGITFGLLVNAVTENTFLYSVPMFMFAVLLGSRLRRKASHQPFEGLPPQNQLR